MDGSKEADGGHKEEDETEEAEEAHMKVSEAEGTTGDMQLLQP